MTSLLFGSGQSAPDQPPSRHELEILVTVLADLEAALDNIDTAARPDNAPRAVLARVRTDLDRAIALVRERIARRAGPGTRETRRQ